MRIGKYTGLELTIPRDLTEDDIILAICQIFNLRMYYIIVLLPGFSTWGERVIQIEDDVYYRPYTAWMINEECIVSGTNARYNKSYTRDDLSIAIGESEWDINPERQLDVEKAKRYIISNEMFIKTFVNLQHDDGAYIFSKNVRNMMNTTLTGNHRL